LRIEIAENVKKYFFRYVLFRLRKVAFEAEIGMFEREKTHAFFEKISGLNPFITHTKPAKNRFTL